MGVRLTIKMKSAGGADQTKTVLLDDDVITLGRDQSCQVVLAQQAVSRNHARISQDGTLFFIEDLGSSYGTLVGGQKLPKGEKRLLNNGDVIAIAQFDLTFDRVAEASEDRSGKTMFVSGKLVKDVMKGLAGGESAYFRVMNGPREGQRIELADAQEYVFGRDQSGADIVLNDDLVSRRHAKVRRDWSGTHLEDLGSRNGIKVNKQRTKKADLKDRDEVEIGTVRLLFIDPSEVREAPVVLPSATAADEGEHTEAVNEPDEAPEAQAEASAEPEPAADPEPPAEEPPPDEAPPGEEEPPADEPPGDVETSDGPTPEDDEAEPAEEDARGAGKLLDLSNRQTQIALAIGGLMVLMGVVLIVLLAVGA